MNLGRVDVVWRCITSHLLLVCQHPHLRMRQWGCEAITFLSRQALQHSYTPPLHDNNRLQTLLLSPLVMAQYKVLDTDCYRLNTGPIYRYLFHQIFWRLWLAYTNTKTSLYCIVTYEIPDWSCLSFRQ